MQLQITLPYFRSQQTITGLLIAEAVMNIECPVAMTNDLV